MSIYNYLLKNRVFQVYDENNNLKEITDSKPANNENYLISNTTLPYYASTFLDQDSLPFVDEIVGTYYDKSKKAHTCQITYDHYLEEFSAYFLTTRAKVGGFTTIEDLTQYLDGNSTST